MLDEFPSLERFAGTTIANYRLDHLVSRSPLGAVYLAQRGGDNGAFLLRIITLPRGGVGARPGAGRVGQGDDAAGYPANVAAPSLPGGASPTEEYLARFQQEARRLATLQHPYILPLVDFGVFGVFQETPYLVWPQLPLRSLASRLAQSGPVDALTAGRYLDQITGALEYAHEHSTLHRNLSAACVYLQRDGRLIVADFGVRRLIELGRADAEQYAINALDEACAPEQIRGDPVSSATDVYGLGETLYQMLVGASVFPGATRQAVAQRHLSDRVPAVSATRPGIPAALDPLLARALAKEPERRFRQPGAFANAYNQIVAPNSAARVPFVMTIDAPPSGPLTAGAPSPISAPASFGALQPTSAPSAASIGETMRAGYGAQGDRGSLDGLGEQDGREALRLAAPPARRHRRGGLLRRPWVIALVVLVVVALLGGETLAALAARGASGAPAASGSASFSESAASQSAALGRTDTFHLVAQHLPTLPTGSHYAAWLINDQSENVFPLGALVAQPGQPGAYTLALTGQSGQPGPTLLALANRLEVTVEQGNTLAPVGRVALVGVFPPLAFVHIRHLLVSFPATPGQVGLLVGLLDQTRLLYAQTQAFARASASLDTATARCLAQSIVDIAEGANGAAYKPLSAACVAQGVSATGDGFGLLPSGADSLAGRQGNTYAETDYLADASAHASLAATQKDATTTIRTYARQVELCVANIQGWGTSLDRQATSWLANPAQPQLGQSLVSLAREAYLGQGATNGGANGGAEAAFHDGQLMATLPLSARA